MNDIAISVENVSKFYRLGSIGNRTLYQDLNRWWAKARGRPDPLLKIGDADHGNRSSGGLWALDDVSLEIRQGDVLGIIGHNGAGKSTLLKILSRVTGPTSGQIRVRGRIASLLEVGTGFHPDLTGRENIYLNGAILGMTREEIRRKFDEIVAFADVERFIDTPVKRYSSGMYVRLAFAVAAHLEPEILVVDEVLAVGDLAFQEKCLGKMGQVSREGRTVLFVSHNLQSIWSLCPNAIWLDRGKLRAAGEAPEIIEMYRSAHQDTSQNALDGLKRSGTGRVRVTKIQFENQDGEPLLSVPAGGAVRIALHYRAEPDSRLDNLLAYVVIVNEHHVRLLTLSNVFSGGRFEELAPEGVLVCAIDRLPLIPGEYGLIVSLLLGNESVDKFISPLRLSVAEGDFFGTNRMPDKALGNVLVTHQWSALTKSSGESYGDERTS